MFKILKRAKAAGMLYRASCYLFDKHKDSNNVPELIAATNAINIINSCLNEIYNAR